MIPPFKMMNLEETMVITLITYKTLLNNIVEGLQVNMEEHLDKEVNLTMMLDFPQAEHYKVHLINHQILIRVLHLHSNTECNHLFMEVEAVDINHRFIMHMLVPFISQDLMGQSLQQNLVLREVNLEYRKVLTTVQIKVLRLTLLIQKLKESAIPLHTELIGTHQYLLLH